MHSGTIRLHLAKRISNQWLSCGGRIQKIDLGWFLMTICLCGCSKLLIGICNRLNAANAEITVCYCATQHCHEAFVTQLVSTVRGDDM